MYIVQVYFHYQIMGKFSPLQFSAFSPIPLIVFFLIMHALLCIVRLTSCSVYIHAPFSLNLRY